MPTSIGAVMRAGDDDDVELPEAVLPGDPGAAAPPGARTPPDPAPPTPGVAGPGATPAGSCEPVEACGADRPSAVWPPGCDWSVDVRRVVPHPASPKLPAAATAATARRAAARERSATPVTRPTLGTSGRGCDVAPDETASPHWLSATKSPLERPQLGGLRRTQHVGSHVPGAGFDRLADAEVGAAAADVADLVEVGVADLAAVPVRLADLRHRGHDLAGLAVAALGDIALQPRLLHRVEVLADGLGQALDRGDLVIRLDLADRHRARVERLAVDVRRARLADLDAAAVLRAGDAEQVTQNPKEPYVVRCVDRHALSVELEGVLRHGGCLLARVVKAVAGRRRDRRLRRERTERQRGTVGDWELVRHLRGRPSERTGDRALRHRDRELARATRRVGRRWHHDDLDLPGDVPLPRVVVVVPAALEEVAVVQVQALGEDLPDGVHRAALHLRLEPAGVDRQSDVDGDDELGDPWSGDSLMEPPVARVLPAVDLGERCDLAVVLGVERDALGRARRHAPAPPGRLRRGLVDGPRLVVLDERLAERVGALPHGLRQPVDDELAGDSG